MLIFCSKLIYFQQIFLLENKPFTRVVSLTLMIPSLKFFIASEQLHSPTHIFVKRETGNEIVLGYQLGGKQVHLF